MKAVRSNTKISPHGGAVPILKKIQEFGIPQVIRSVLGVRKKQSKYGYEDILIAWVLTALCGGTRLEHISKLRKKLNIIPGLKLPSHDTLGRAMKALATKVQVKRYLNSKADVYTNFNENIQMNRMLVEVTKRTKALQENRSYTMHIDATFIPTECRGAVRKRDKDGKVNVAKIGFNPMVCLINELPVFISMRDGYANAHFELGACLRNSLQLLSESKIKVGRLISDAAGYNKEAFEYLHSKDIKFLVRFPFQTRVEAFKKALVDAQWRKTEIDTANFNWVCEVASIQYKMHDHYSSKQVSPTWRVVAMRVPIVETTEEAREIKRKNLTRLNELEKTERLKGEGKSCLEGKWIKYGNYMYKLVITNDYTLAEEQLIVEYNKRGHAERVISFMKNDFAWRLPPFMNMNENTVFMIAASLANNIFRGMVMTFKKFIPGVSQKSRLREFQFVFINVACAYINETYIFYNTDIAFEKII